MTPEADPLAAQAAPSGAAALSPTPPVLRVALGPEWRDHRRTLLRVALGYVGLVAACCVATLATTSPQTEVAWALPGLLSLATLGLLALLVVTLVACLLSPRVVLSVGADGVSIERDARCRRVPAAEIDRLVVDGGAVGLWLATETVWLPTSRLEPAEREQVLAALRALVRAPPPDLIDALARRGRSLPAWRQALRPGGPRGAFREAGAADEALVAVLEHPRSLPEQRIGAALALAALPDGRERIRAFAARCVDADLQRALEAAADERDDADVVERALRSGDLEA